MAMNELIKEVEQITQAELNRANASFPLFNSKHEGYAVIKEELEETREVLDTLESSIAVLWEKVKGNNPTYFIVDKTLPMAIYEDAINAACGMIQVAAMLLKYEMSFQNTEESERTNNE